IYFIFFFSSRRRHTRSKRDWSSDVCSSDLRRINFDRLLIDRRTKGAQCMRQIIKNATLTNGQKCNIVIDNQKISAITADDCDDGTIIALPDGVYVSPGWIDIHTHSFPKYEPYRAYPDDVGYKTGVTTVVDAGSSGANDIDEFHALANKSITRVFSFLNISSVGLKISNELA